jgi:pyocin large subunit-like protein
MNKQYRDYQGNARKWIDRRYSKPYKARRAASMMMAGGMSAQTISAVQTIQSVKAITKAQKLSKAFAIAEIITNDATNKNKLIRGESPVLHAKTLPCQHMA